MENPQVPCTPQPTSKGATATLSSSVTSFFLFHAPHAWLACLPHAFRMLCGFLCCRPAAVRRVPIGLSLHPCRHAQVPRRHAVLGFR